MTTAAAGPTAKKEKTHAWLQWRKDVLFEHMHKGVSSSSPAPYTSNKLSARQR